MNSTNLKHSLLYGAEELFFDFSFRKTDWRQIFFPWNEQFQWIIGETPMSSWQILPFAWILYFTIIVGLKSWMSSRPPFGLKIISILHNLILCVWSAIMFLGVGYEILKTLQSGGSTNLYCGKQLPATGRIYYWIYIYYLSKFVELFDTVIIILKKKPLIFLHYYHHAIVILMVWLWLTHGLIYTSLGMAFNTFVHVFMYYYYAVSLMGVQPWWKKYITMVQIVQFISSFLLSIPYVYYTWFFGSKGEPMCTGWNAFTFSLFVNSSFLTLFVRFWQQTYQKPKQK